MIRRIILSIGLALISCAASTIPASAQFYKNRTLTLLINFAAGGNVDVEARVYQRYLSKHIPGNPSIVIQNAPGAGGLNAMNMLGLEIGPKADGFTAGYFTMNPVVAILGDPGLRVALSDFIVVAGERGWNVAYGRKDIPPGLSRPADLTKATGIFAGGYSRNSAIDTRLRLALEVLGTPYKMITGFPGTADVNKAMIQNEVNFTSSSLPAYLSQATPEIIKTGIGMPLFDFPIMNRDGQPVGDPVLEKEGIPAFNELYKTAFGREPTGQKWDALLLISTLNTQMLRGVLLPKGSPPAAVAALRQGFESIARDQEFLSEFERVVGERPDIVTAADLQPLFERMRNVDSTLKKVIQASINDRGGVR